ncbi:MFS general substrate transporter [Aspergillus varians]
MTSYHCKIILILQKVSPQVYLTISMLCWSFLTLGLSFVTNWHQIMAIRFCLGLFESATFVGSHYIMGSWYNSDEIGKRTAVFAASGVAGNMFSGFLQGAIHRNLDGLNGRAGWRWLFIIDFLITIPIALLGYLVFPGHPEMTKSKFLKPEEKTLAIERLPEPLIRRGNLGWSLVRRVVLSWEIYALSLLALLAGDSEMWADNGILSLYLKSLGTLVSILLCSWYVDYFVKAGGRWHVGLFLSITAIISGAIMLNPPNHSAKMFALFINGLQLGYRGVLFAWANDLMRNDDAKRGIVISMMNAMTIAFYIFWTLLFYNTEQAPMWREGSIAMIVTGVCMALSVGSVVFFERRQEKNAGSVLEGEDSIVGSDQEVAVVPNKMDKSSDIV